MQKDDPLKHLVRDKNNESDSDTNNAVAPSDNDSIGILENSEVNINPKTEIDLQLLKEIEDIGFDKEKIELAMKMEKSKEQIIDLIMRMNDDPELFNQMKENSKISELEQHPIYNFGQSYEYKMVIVVRKDLKMGVGKIAAQVGHAVLGCFRIACAKNMMTVHLWDNCGTPKIVVGCNNAEELHELINKANKENIVNYLVTDAGRTEVPSGTETCCAFGPELVNKINLVTGDLPLL